MYFHTGLRHQRGAGLGAIFGGMLRMLKPLAQMGLTAGKRFLGSDLAKRVGREALDVGKKSAINIVTDLLEGIPLKVSAERELDDAKSKIATAIKGEGGGKRKRKHNLSIDVTWCT